MPVDERTEFKRALGDDAHSIPRSLIRAKLFAKFARELWVISNPPSGESSTAPPR